ncbi:MAG: GNAT family N-acetyltransferase [Lachnospiraceae bacterium]|nr:GNAT family N-acetyltransferase [Lachnospiraceae bacterium]
MSEHELENLDGQEQVTEPQQEPAAQQEPDAAGPAETEVSASEGAEARELPGNGKIPRQEAIERLTLALLYLTRFPDEEGRQFDEIAWRGYDFDTLYSLDEQDLVVNPKVSRSGGSKYVYLTEKGRDEARKILDTLDIADTDLYEKFEFRCIRPEEAEEAAQLEQTCFSAEEACKKEDMIARVQAASDLFLVAVDRKTGRLAGFLNGIATGETDFRDAFFTDASLHREDGENIMILGLAVAPEYRRQGLARELVYNYCRREQERGRCRLILTCRDSAVVIYKKLGFRDMGVSASEWAGEKWREMKIILNW